MPNKVFVLFEEFLHVVISKFRFLPEFEFGGLSEDHFGGVPGH